MIERDLQLRGGNRVAHRGTNDGLAEAPRAAMVDLGGLAEGNPDLIAAPGDLRQIRGQPRLQLLEMVPVNIAEHAGIGLAMDEGHHRLQHGAAVGIAEGPGAGRGAQDPGILDAAAG